MNSSRSRSALNGGGKHWPSSSPRIKATNFAKIEKVKIDVKATEGGEATVNGVTSVEKLVGESVVLTAIPSEGYDFVNWTLNGAEVSTEKVFEVKIVSSAEYVATFVKKIVNYVVILFLIRSVVFIKTYYIKEQQIKEVYALIFR